MRGSRSGRRRSGTICNWRSPENSNGGSHKAASGCSSSHRRSDACARSVRRSRRATQKVFWFASLEAIRADGFFAPVWLRPTGDERRPFYRNTMKYCYECGRVTAGEPLFCQFCGRTYNVKLCPRLHVNPRFAEVCSQCGSRDLSTPQPKVSVWWRIGACSREGSARCATCLCVPCASCRTALDTRSAERIDRSRTCCSWRSGFSGACCRIGSRKQSIGH